MIAALLLWGCQCGSSSSLPRPEKTTFDRSTVRGATCYRGDDGMVLELVVSAGATATGVITRPGEEPKPLQGRRTGRALDFGTVNVELLGRTVALTDGEATRMLQATGCPEPVQ